MVGLSPRNSTKIWYVLDYDDEQFLPTKSPADISPETD